MVSTDLQELWEDIKPPDPDEFAPPKVPHFGSLIESIVYNIADVQGMWQGDHALSCGVFAEVYLDSSVQAVIEFMIRDADALPRFWIVQKYPTVRCIAYDTQRGVQDWYDTLFSEQTALTMELFGELSLL